MKHLPSILLFFFLFINPILPHVIAQEQNTSRSGSLKVMEIRENLKERKEAFQKLKETRKEALKNRLKNFKDRVKAERVDRINTILSFINTNKMTTLLASIEKMESIVKRLENKIAELEKEGKDSAAAKQTTTDAKTAIATAKEAVSAQATKDYTITLTSEENAKTDANTIRKTLQEDLQLVHQQVVDARQKVATAISQTKLLLGETNNGQ